MCQIAAASRQQVVESYYSVAFRNQAVAHVRADKAGGAGNDDSQISSCIFSGCPYLIQAARIFFELSSILAEPVSQAHVTFNFGDMTDASWTERALVLV